MFSFKVHFILYIKKKKSIVTDSTLLPCTLLQNIIATTSL